MCLSKRGRKDCSESYCETGQITGNRKILKIENRLERKEDMELRTETIRTEEKKGPAMTQVTFDETYHLPDYLPDFFSVILSRGQIRIRETVCSEGHVAVQGILEFWVLYRTGQNEWNICSLEGTFPFREMLSLDAAKEFDMAQAEAVLEDLTVRMMNARKLNIRALMEIRVWTRERMERKIPVAIDGTDRIEELYKTESYFEVCYRGTENWKMKEEVRLPSNKPNIRQVLWQQHQLLGRSVRVNQGEVQIQGEVQLFLIYLGAEEDRIQWLDLRVPYQNILEITEAQSDMIPYICGQEPVFNCQVQEDADGEERILLLETDTPLELRLYREISKNVLADAYSLEKNLLLQKQTVKVQQFHMKNEARCRVNDSLDIENAETEILQIGAGLGRVEPEHWEITENGIHVEGTVRISVLYLTSSDAFPVEATEGLIPFQCEIEVPGIQPHFQVELQTSLEHLSFLMKTGKELEVQAVISAEVMVTKEKTCELISGMEVQEYEVAVLSQIPGIAGVKLQQEDDLWSLAKKFHTTTEDIRKINHLKDEDLLEGRKILIVKQ